MSLKETNPSKNKYVYQEMLLTELAEIAKGLDLTLFHSPGCTDPTHQVAVVTNCLFTLTPHICGSSVWDLLHVTLAGA
jgi:hypothetical protein